MQKDMHYYMTNYLARKAGISPGISNKIAWACQFVDDQAYAEPGKIQTQCAIDIGGNWKDPHVQQTVLAAFHFVPGDDPGTHPWMTTPDSDLARHLLAEAIATENPYRIGIAIHAMQDTFSHQGFTAFEEKFNSCFGWDNLVAFGIPSVGHADVRRAPDVMNAKWVDPRSGEVIDNTERGRRMAGAIYWSLCQASDCDSPVDSPRVGSSLKPFWAIQSYNERKSWLRNRPNEMTMPSCRQMLGQGFERDNELKIPFTNAARQHLALALKHFPEEMPTE